MNKKEVETKIREITYAYQLIADLKKKLYNACPKEKRTELYDELRKVQYDSDTEACAKNIQKIIGTDTKENEYAEPASFCYNKRFKAKSLTAKNNRLEMRTFMENARNFIEAIIDLRREKDEIYRSVVKVTRKAGSQDLEVFLYGNFTEISCSENYKHFVKKAFEKEKN